MRKRLGGLRLTREGLYHLGVLCFVLTGAWLRDISLLYVVGGLMLGPLLLSLPIVSLTLRGVKIARKHPKSICADDLLVVTLDVHNTKRRLFSRAILIEDRLVRVMGSSAESGRVGKSGSSPGAESAMTLVPKIGPGATVRLNYQGHLSQRGLYRFENIQMLSRYPMGLIQRTITVDAPSTLVVYPKLGMLTPQWRKVYLPSRGGARRRFRQQSVSNADFYALRDWRTGDSNRWVHWPTSARRGSLIVKQFEQRRQSDLVLLVDLWLPQSPTPADMQRAEEAIRFAATVADDVCRGGGGRLLVGIAGREFWKADAIASAGFLSEVLHRLAIAEADQRDQLAELLTTIPSGQKRPAVVLATTRDLDAQKLRSALEAHSDPRVLAAMGRMLVLRAGTTMMREYFRTEEVVPLRPEFVS